MADMITRCPNCETSFRITESQIQTARGAVRCGACLHIFRALDNLVGDHSHRSDAAAKRPATSKQANAQHAEPQRTTPPVKPTATAAATAKSSPAPVGRSTVSAPTTIKPAATPNANAVKAAPDKTASDRTTVRPANPAANPAANSAANNAVSNATRAAPATESPRKSNIELPKFEYKKPAAAAAPPAASKPARAPVPLNEFGIPDNILDDDYPANPTAIANRLSFDQSAIDGDDAPESALISDDDLLISDDLELPGDPPKKTKPDREDDLAESFLDLDAWKPKEKSLFDREIKAKPNNHDQDRQNAGDESWAVELLEDDESEETYSFSKPGKKAARRNPLDELEMDEPGSDGPEEYSRHTTGSFNAVEDSDIEDALGKPLSEAAIEPRISDEHLDLDEEFAESDYAASTYGAKSAYDAEEEAEEDYYADHDRHAMLRGIQPEPVVFSYRQQQLDWKKLGIWGSALAACLIVLITQIAWFNFESLSRIPPYRSFYAGVCPLVGCTLPSVAAPHLIRTTNFMVREHPSGKQALMVDTIILNTADFTQPFPDLVLNFSDLKGKLVATRRFTPAEYLGGELAGKNQMPSNQPVHLALEIVNPGPDAVNYSAFIPQ